MRPVDFLDELLQNTVFIEVVGHILGVLGVAEILHKLLLLGQRQVLFADLIQTVLGFGEFVIIHFIIDLEPSQQAVGECFDKGVLAVPHPIDIRVVLGQLQIPQGRHQIPSRVPVLVFIVILWGLLLSFERCIYAGVLKVNNLLCYLFCTHTIFGLIFQLSKIAQYINMQQPQDKDDPIRIVVIGLPYSGKDEVAKILGEKYKCDLIEMKNLDPKEEEHKGVAKLCFQKFEGRGVLVLDPCHSKTLYHLKKRNFVNVISVDAPFKKRLSLYCGQKKIDMDLTAFSQFSNLDSDYQTDDYRKCLQFVRIRLYNDKDIPELSNSIQQNITQILRPFRPSYDQYFMKMADIAKRRSNCMKSSVGCVIVNDSNRVVSTGFNGTPRGLISCFKNGCTRCNSGDERGLDECLCLHGEESAILEVGISRTQGCKLYTTLYPCFSCAKIIKQAGIKKIYFMEPYLKIDSGQKFLKQNFKPEEVVQVKVNNIYY